MPTETDYSHRTTVQKLGVRAGDRVEIAGDVGPGLRRDVKEVTGRGLVRSAIATNMRLPHHSRQHVEQLDLSRP